jgi:hypothetical protein
MWKLSGQRYRSCTHNVCQLPYAVAAHDDACKTSRSRALPYITGRDGPARLRAWADMGSALVACGEGAGRLFGPGPVRCVASGGPCQSCRNRRGRSERAAGVPKPGRRGPRLSRKNLVSGPKPVRGGPKSLLGGPGLRGQVHIAAGHNRNIAGQNHKLGQDELLAEELRYQPRLMGRSLRRPGTTRTVSPGLEHDPELAFAGRWSSSPRLSLQASPRVGQPRLPAGYRRRWS